MTYLFYTYEMRLHSLLHTHIFTKKIKMSTNENTTPHADELNTNAKPSESEQNNNSTQSTTEFNENPKQSTTELSENTPPPAKKLQAKNEDSITLDWITSKSNLSLNAEYQNKLRIIASACKDQHNATSMFKYLMDSYLANKVGESESEETISNLENIIDENKNYINQLLTEISDLKKQSTFYDAEIEQLKQASTKINVSNKPVEQPQKKAPGFFNMFG